MEQHAYKCICSVVQDLIIRLAVICQFDGDDIFLSFKPPPPEQEEYFNMVVLVLSRQQSHYGPLWSQESVCSVNCFVVCT